MSQLNPASPNRILALSAEVYRQMLAVYPARFRDEYGPHMAQVFRDCCREAFRRRRWLGVAWLWITALADLGLTAAHEWLGNNRGPSHYAHKLGLGLAAGMAGGAAAGLGSRLSMRGIALAGGLQPTFTLEGTLGLLIIGIIIGMPFGLAFVALRRFLPGTGIGRGLVYGLFLFLIGLAPPLLFYREGEFLLASPLMGLALFAPLGPLYGGVVAWAAGRLDRDAQFGDEAPRPAAGLRLKTLAAQLPAILAFAALLELGVLGTVSITHHVPRLPLVIVRSLPPLGVSFETARDAHAALVNLAALIYFGVASLLFWGRGRRRMARAAGLCLLLFGGAVFNTGAAYYRGLLGDPARWQPVFHGLQVAGCTALVALFYYFPDGRLAAGWLRPVGLSWLLIAGVWLATPQMPDALAGLILCVFLGAGALAQFQRRRAATPEEREQLRWPARGFGLAVGGLALVAGVLMLMPELKLPKVAGLSAAAAFGPYMLPWLALPVTIGYAVWRRGLWARA
jgi:hypothetical protein